MLFKSLLIILFISTVSFAQQPGDFDLNFGNQGHAYTGFPGQMHDGGFMAVQSDGKIIIAGRMNTLIFVSRFSENGVLDTSFGDNGDVVLNNGGTRTVKVQEDGKIIAAGYAQMIRLLPNGDLDTTFGDNGTLITSVNGVDFYFKDISVQPDGKILAVGTGGYDDFTIIRYEPNGELDASFGNGGIVVTSGIQESSLSNEMVLQPDGKIIVSGYAQMDDVDNLAMVRYLSNGSLDSSFGNNGIVISSINSDPTVDEISNGLLLQPDGKIVLSGFFSDPGNPRLFFLSRFEPSGEIDTSFGDNGTVINNFDGVSTTHNIILQPDNKIVRVGYESGDFQIARHMPNGDLDPLFGNGGITSGGDYTNVGHSIAMQSNGKLLVGGYTTFPDFSTALTVMRVFSGLNLGTLDFENISAELVVYPNPVSDLAKIDYEITAEETISIDLYDLTGKHIKQFENNVARFAGQHSEELDLVGLETGNYLIVLKNSKGNKVGVNLIKL